MRQALRTCLWLFAPILVMNAALTAELPAAYQADVFWRDIPPWLAAVEHGSRVALFALITLVPIEVHLRVQRIGLAVYLLGLLVYGASWAALIVWPDGAWSQSAIGFTAPAWTPALWLTGLTLLAERSFVPRLKRPRRAIAACAVVFLIAHLGHALLVFYRL